MEVVLDAEVVVVDIIEVVLVAGKTLVVGGTVLELTIVVVVLGGTEVVVVLGTVVVVAGREVVVKIVVVVDIEVVLGVADDVVDVG